MYGYYREKIKCSSLRVTSIVLKGVWLQLLSFSFRMYWFKWVFMWYRLMVCWSGKHAVMCWNAMLVSGEFIFNCRLVENLKILLIKCYEFVLMEKCRKKEETNWLKWNTNWKRMNSITPLQLFTDEERRQNYQLEGVILIKHQILSTDLQGIVLKVEGRLLLGRHMEL